MKTLVLTADTGGQAAKSAEVENYLSNKSKKGDVVVVMGAGDIYKIAENLV